MSIKLGGDSGPPHSSGGEWGGEGAPYVGGIFYEYIVSVTIGWISVEVVLWCFFVFTVIRILLCNSSWLWKVYITSSLINKYNYANIYLLQLEPPLGALYQSGRLLDSKPINMWSYSYLHFHSQNIRTHKQFVSLIYCTFLTILVMSFCNCVDVSQATWEQCFTV